MNNRSKQTNPLILVALALSLGSFARASTDTSVSTKLETPKKYGVYASIGNPYPTLLGVNGAYNFNKNIRASIGYGEVTVTTGLSFDGTSMTTQEVTAKTYAAGGEYLFLDSPVRGVVGLRAGYFSVSGDGEIEIDGFNKSTGYAYSNLGLDWISQSGYQLGAGYNVAFAGATGAGIYINSGWFF